MTACVARPDGRFRGEDEYMFLHDLTRDAAYETLTEDDSPGLVAAGLACVARGDADAASEHYEKLVERWRAVQLLERCN